MWRRYTNQPFNLRFCALHQFGAQRMGYPFSAKTKMANICYQMRSQSLQVAHRPHEDWAGSHWGSIEIYCILERVCMRKISQESFMYCENNGLNVWTGLDKHGYHSFCLEATKRFQIINNDHPPKHIDFAEGKLAYIVTTKYDVVNGNEAKDEDGKW